MKGGKQEKNKINNKFLIEAQLQIQEAAQRRLNGHPGYVELIYSKIEKSRSQQKKYFDLMTCAMKKGHLQELVSIGEDAKEILDYLEKNHGLSDMPEEILEKMKRIKHRFRKNIFL